MRLHHLALTIVLAAVPSVRVTAGGGGTPAPPPEPKQVYQEIWGLVMGGDAVPIFTVPAGKRLYLTDIQIVRNPMGEMSDADGVPMLVLSRESQTSNSPLNFAAILRAWVPAYQNVFISLRTPIEIKGPDKLQGRCSSSKSNKALFIHAFGHLK